MALRRYPEVDRYFANQLRLTPDSTDAWLTRIRLLVEWKGTTVEAWELLAKAPAAVQPTLLCARVRLNLFDRDFAKAIAGGAPSQQSQLDALGCPWSLTYAYLRAGRRAEATELARRIVESANQELADNPQAVGAHRLLGLTHALLGERPEALEHANQAVELQADDAYWGPQSKENLAVVLALLDEREKAIDLVAELLDQQYRHPLNVQRLRLEPWWDPLRDEPRFQELVAKP